MKVNLKCSEQENYILVYMGCYDYCETDICEKNEEDVKTPEIIPTNSASTPGKSSTKILLNRHQLQMNHLIHQNLV